MHIKKEKKKDYFRKLIKISILLFGAGELSICFDGRKTVPFALTIKIEDARDAEMREGADKNNNKKVRNRCAMQNNKRKIGLSMCLYYMGRITDDIVVFQLIRFGHVSFIADVGNKQRIT